MNDTIAAEIIYNNGNSTAGFWAKVHQIGVRPAGEETNGENAIGHHHNHRDAGTYTMTTSVAIRVTPVDDYFVSWGILWCGFVLASCLAAWQCYIEYMHSSKRRQKVVADEESVVGDLTGMMSTEKRRRRQQQRQRHDTEGGTGDGEHHSESTADITRYMFRRLLLLAMLLRVIMMPVQIWSEPIYWQFFCDTLPEMIFASAWTVQVVFFVQLVGIALGTGINTVPGIVIQTTAYIIYVILISLNSVASVLLYAFFCCIYAALFGTSIFFLPRLLLILRPITMSHSGMAIRLLVCTVLCICLFGAHIIWYARLVVAPPHRVYWWYIYGALELFPAIAFLIIMHPNVGSNNDNDNKREDDTPPDATSGHQHASQPRFLSSALDAPDIGKIYPSSNAALLTRSLSSGGSINKSINKINSSRSPPPPSATKETSLLISRNFSAPGTTRSSSATPPPPPPFQPMGGGYGATSTT